MTKKELDRLTIPVRWGDLDLYGHLNNTVYFRFFEEARVHWLEKNHFSVRGINTGPVLIQCSATFLREVNHPATIVITTTAGEIGRTSLVIHHQILSEDLQTLHCEGQAKLVWVDHKSGKSILLPDTLKALLAD